MDLPHGMPGIPEPSTTQTKPKSQFGNPIWHHDDDPASGEERRGRRQGVEEALRLIEGPSIMTNNTEFQTGLDAAITLLRRRLAEL